ncbi:gamma-glutamylcyclotransferase [Aureimonas endophytica]|uniref:Gamma-glutamylcyclotransferase n=1 Tax=Aureimonas endophytica TaxID=2027858 RepID=A0A917E0J3_9HYPH|nr:gamma-glutamylcyclotransferase family protein [Aureimonas endophytica]GGD91412.1 gamma-glutamylcyclotransferase [Aureimonas endophytica]
MSRAEAPGTASLHPDHPDFARLAAEGRVVAYFGYGSLVNRDTLRTKFLAVRRAAVTGWRRFWLPRPEVGIALLSVRPAPGHETQGVVVYDLADHLPAVDEREAGYDRRSLGPEVLTIEAMPDVPVPVFLYEATRTTETAAETGSAILQSYLDAVLQGFLAIHGEAGLERFVAETEGFETVVIRDRAAPRYPRAVRLRPGEAERFDALLAGRGVAFADD